MRRQGLGDRGAESGESEGIFPALRIILSNFCAGDPTKVKALCRGAWSGPSQREQCATNAVFLRT